MQRAQLASDDGFRDCERIASQQVDLGEYLGPQLGLPSGKAGSSKGRHALTNTIAAWSRSFKVRNRLLITSPERS
jgi:hypothetical protein